MSIATGRRRHPLDGHIFDDRDRRILALAIPALAGLAVEPLYVLVDTVIVGHLGKAPLGGLALASTVLTLSFWLFQFLSTGVTTKVAFRAGQADPAGGARVAAQGLWLALLISILNAPVLRSIAWAGRKNAMPRQRLSQPCSKAQPVCWMMW